MIIETNFKKSEYEENAFEFLLNFANTTLDLVEREIKRIKRGGYDKIFTKKEIEKLKIAKKGAELLATREEGVEIDNIKNELRQNINHDYFEIDDDEAIRLCFNFAYFN